MALSRQETILKLIVEEFISTATPVGSKTLIGKYHLDFSSATIRNDMMALEKDGYIEKTHASSGRVPSSKGYRYYVSKLRENDELHVDSEFKKEFQLILAKKSQSVEDIMNKSCQILSEMTNMATVVLGPDANEEHLVSLSVVPLSEHAATAIFVTDRGYVENKTFVIKNEKDGKSITSCVEFLNKRLSGTAISQLSEKITALRPILDDVLGKSAEVVMESFIEAFMKFAKDRIYATGTQKLIDIPEFGEDKEKLQNVLDLINDPAKFRQAIGQEEEKSPAGDEGDVSFTQDKDNDLAIVSEDFSIEGLPSNTIAVVGPQRMNYKKVIGTLEYIAKELNKYFAMDPNGDNNKKKNAEKGKEKGNGSGAGK